MLIGLLILIGVVGLVFTLAAKDSTLIKSVAFFWLVTALFLGLLGSHLFKGELLVPRSKMLLPFGLYLCLCLLSTLFSGYRYAAAQELISLLCCGMLLFVTVSAVRNQRGFLLVAGMLAAVAAMSCLYGILQHYGFDPLISGEVSWPWRERPFSTMGHPNFFGAFLVLVLPILLSLFYWGGRGLLKGFVLILICAVQLCLLYTQSRGAWLGYLGALPVWFFLSLRCSRWRLILLLPVVAVVAAMLVMLLSEGARQYAILWALPFWLTAILILQLTAPERAVRFPGKPMWSAMLVAGVVLVSGLLVAPQDVGERMRAAFETEKGSVRTRKIIWAGTFKMLKARPILGFGAGRFTIFFPRFRDPLTAGKIMPNTLHAHSEYLEVAAETGIVGFGLFLWMLGAFIWDGLRKIDRASDALQKMAIAGLLAGCAAVLIQATVCVATRWVVGRFFLWLGMGLTIAVGGMSPSPRKTHRKTKNDPALDQQAGNFWRMRIRSFRGPPARAAFVIFAAAITVLAGLWAVRLFASAVLTRKGEGYLIAAEKTAIDSASDDQLAASLHERELLQERGIELFKRAIELNPWNLSAYYKLAHCYNLQGKFEESLATYDRMARLAPDGSDIHFNLGVVYANMRRWDDSRREFETALSMKIGPLSRLGLARTYENLRLFDRAEKQYSAVVEDFPDFRARGLNGLAGIHLRRGDSRKAMELYRKALDIDPDDADAHLGAGLAFQVLADYHRANGDSELALNYYEKSIAEQEAALARKPDNAAIRAALALVYAEVGRFQEALAQLRTALTVKPGDPLAYLNLGKVYRRMGERDRAAEEFQRTRTIDPTGPWGQEATKELRAMGME